MLPLRFSFLAISILHPLIRLLPRMDRPEAASDRVDALMRPLTQQARCASNLEGNTYP